jgi:hypothetical protein
MTKRIFRVREGEPLLDIVSYGRSGARENGGRLTHAQIEQIRRTVQRAPEVVVKVLPRASNDLKAAGKHLDYISRSGKLDIETDDGERLHVRSGSALLHDWDLDIDDMRRQADLTTTKGRKPPKLIHKLMFSMPPGTSPDGVLTAVRNFAREEFWGQHRYAFVLHTDEDHPHVHLVLKALSEQGVRLNIRRATLRHWRAEFARNLRMLGFSANATERAVRGENRKAVKDAIYRTGLRGESTYIRAQAEAVAKEILNGAVRLEGSKRKMLDTRISVVRGWQNVAERLANSGYRELASEAWQFVREMPRPVTERERIVTELQERLQNQPRLQRTGPAA